MGVPLSVADKWAILDGLEMKQSALQYSRSIDPREVPRYSVGEVALFLHIPEPTLRSWVSGRPFPTMKGEGYSKPVIIPADGDGTLLSFYNLTEAHILRCTREIDGVSMRAIRDGIDYATATYGPSEHPLLTEQFATDGRFLFLEKISGLIENASQGGQLGIETVMRDLLQRIDRDGRKLPNGVYPVIPGRPTSRAVSIRTGVSSGAPVVSGTGILVSVLWGRIQAGDTILDLAEDYAIPPDKIGDALAYLDAA